MKPYDNDDYDSRVFAALALCVCANIIGIIALLIALVFLSVDNITSGIIAAIVGSVMLIVGWFFAQAAKILGR